MLRIFFVHTLQYIQYPFINTTRTLWPLVQMCHTYSFEDRSDYNKAVLLALYVQGKAEVATLFHISVHHRQDGFPTCRMVQMTLCHLLPQTKGRVLCTYKTAVVSLERMLGRLRQRRTIRCFLCVRKYLPECKENSAWAYLSIKQKLRRWTFSLNACSVHILIRSNSIAADLIGH